MTLAETFDQLDWEAIESYAKLGQEENLHLDFKTVKNADMTAIDDKRNLARGISGFANSNGGIIVWGVDARKNADGVDCANSIAEISKPALMVSRLNTLTGDATSPIVDGIRHRAITNPLTNATSDFSVAFFVRRRISRYNHPSASCAHGWTCGFTIRQIGGMMGHDCPPAEDHLRRNARSWRGPWGRGGYSSGSNMAR
jgi:hypothetical protein